MKTAIIGIIILAAIYGIIFGLLIPYVRTRRVNKFRETMKDGDLCSVFYGEQRFYGHLKYVGNPYCTVTFSESEDHPEDKQGHKIIAKNYRREEIYPA